MNNDIFFRILTSYGLAQVLDQVAGKAELPSLANQHGVAAISNLQVQTQYLQSQKSLFNAAVGFEPESAKITIRVAINL